MTRTIDQMIASEVLCCMSSLVATLAESAGKLTIGHEGHPFRAADSGAIFLCHQAFELATPIDDWEETAIEHGWYLNSALGTWVKSSEDGWDRADRVFLHPAA